MSSAAGVLVLSATLRSILGAPGSGAGLADEDGALVGPGGERYAVVEGIPVVLSAGDGLGRREIVAAFRERSSSYYRANYDAGGNPQRERRQAVVVELLASLARPGMTVVDAGAGPAVLAEPARALGLAYVALDLSLDNLLAGRHRIGELDAVVGDLTSIPVKTGAVDGVLAVGSLEYVPGLPRAVAELCRIVKPGGFVVATFANARSPRRWWDERLVAPAIRLRAAVTGKRGTTYRRYLAGADATARLFARHGADVQVPHYVNPGLVGYPLSELRVVALLDGAVSQRFPAVGSEFVLVARKGGGA